jgi:hypothetical protein
VTAAERVRATTVKQGLPLGIRTGLHVGEVAVGDFGSAGRIAFAPVGEPVIPPRVVWASCAWFSMPADPTGRSCSRCRRLLVERPLRMRLHRPDQAGGWVNRAIKLPTAEPTSHPFDGAGLETRSCSHSARSTKSRHPQGFVSSYLCFLARSLQPSALVPKGFG